MMSYRHKNGPGRRYSAEQLTIFRDHRADRERFRPNDCSGGERCWVERGPPAITGAGLCVGCRKRAGEVRKGWRGDKVKAADGN
jgi:hypothetical protein